MTTSALAQRGSFSDAEIFTASASPAGFAWLADGANRTGDPMEGWLPFPHLVLLTGLLMRVAAGEVRRAIVTMPPRHGKSQLISQFFPAWYLGTFPRRKVMILSATSHLAEDFGRAARDALAEYGPPVFGFGVRGDVSAASRWWTERGGSLTAAGFGGTITGRGANLLVIDDPLKNDKEAANARLREEQWTWWKGTARSRLARGGSVVVVQTRWHEDDLSGRMLKHAAENPNADQWEVLDLPALAEGDGDPLRRAAGEALCPPLMPRGELETTRDTIGSYQWSSLYQQRPAPAEGMLHKREHFRYFTVAESADGQPFVHLHNLDGSSAGSYDVGKCIKAQFCDIAASEKQTADYTVVTTILRTPDGHLLIWDVQRRRFDLLKVPEFVEGVWREHGKPQLWVEKFGHGHGVVSTLRSKSIPVRELSPVSDKVTRAMPAVAHYEGSRVFHRREAAWLDGLEAELLAFPNGTNDDMVDTISYAGSKLDSLGSAVQTKVTRVKHKALSTRW